MMPFAAFTLYVRNSLVGSDPATTASHILAAPGLYRAAIVTWLTSQVISVFLVVRLYRLLKPVDVVTEIPSDIKAEPRGAVQKIAGGNHRFLVKRHGAAAVRGDSDRKFGVSLLTSYGTADKAASYWVYEAPSFSAVESAAKASGAPFESIVEIPETLYPY